MATIYTRAGKGSALTWTEADANITNLNTAKLENVVEDTTPQLGGNLDVNGQSIISTSNGDINLTPNGTGKVVTSKQLDASILRSTQSAGDEGGEIQLALAATNNSLTGSVAIDINQNRLRIFETGGSNRGAYIDLSSASTGVGSNLLGSGGGVTVTDDTTTNATRYITFEDVTSGTSTSVGVSSSKLTFNPSTGIVTATGFAGPLSGNATTATTATNATNINISTSDGNASDTAMSVVLVADQTTGNQAPHIDSGLTYNASTNNLTATTFTGSLNGTANNTTNINISTNSGNSNDTTLYPVMVGANSTGSQLPHIDSALSYNASTDVLSVGAINGSVTVNSTSPTTVYNVGLFTSSSGTSLPIASGNLTYSTTNTTLSAPNLSGSLNGAVGATTPSTGVFTTLTANGATNGVTLQTSNTALSSTAWAASGINLRVNARTYTDTSSTGTVATNTINIIGQPTIASTNVTTITDAVNLTVGPPAAGTNTTITNAWAISSTGNIRANAFTSTVATGTAPFTVASTTQVANLNAATAGTATNATNVAITGSATTNASFFLPFVANNTSTNQGLNTQANLSYNPSTLTLSLPNLQSNTHVINGWNAPFGTTGYGLRPLNGTGGTLTDTTTAAGTVAADYFHSFAAPTRASTNAITVTDLVNLYVAQPLTGTNTTATNRYAVLSNGTIKAAEYQETVFAIGNSGTATLTPDAANGNIQTITATGNFTLNAFANPTSGETITFIITQDATGGRTLTSTMRFAGGSKTLSTAANAIDILTVSYIGTTYYASLAKGFV